MNDIESHSLACPSRPHRFTGGERQDSSALIPPLLSWPYTSASPASHGYYTTRALLEPAKIRRRHHLFLGEILFAPPPPAKSCSTSSHVEFWYWERSKKDMLWSLRLKLNLSRLGVVTQWQRTRRREFCHDDDDGAPFFVDRYWDIFTFMDIFFHSAWVRWSPYNRSRRRVFRDCWEKASLVFDGIPHDDAPRARSAAKEWPTWILSDCWQSVNAKQDKRELDLFLVVLWVSLSSANRVCSTKKGQGHSCRRES
jgi:hypothetical protein